MFQKRFFKPLADRSSSESDNSEESLLGQDVQNNEELFRLRKSYQQAKIVIFGFIVALLLSVAYTIYLRLHLHASYLPLGADPSGIVPPEIGATLGWYKFDESDPYFIEPTVFDNISNAENTVRKLIELDHRNPGVRQNGKEVTYLGTDGATHVLPPIMAESKNGSYPMFTIRAFHQMHCITLFIDEYGHRLHGAASHWPPEHIAHCMNVLREAVFCLADASPASKTHIGDDHIGIGQQSRCRNYTALRDYADDPSRRSRYEGSVEDLI